MKRWYVVNTKAREEMRAAANLDQQGFETYLPRYLKNRRHARRVEKVAQPLFPRYLFVAMDLEARRWRSVMSTRGVVNLVCHGELPSAVPPGVVDEIRAREDDRGFVSVNTETSFTKGQLLRVSAGALCDQLGLFDHVDEAKRVVMLLRLLGREVSVRLPMDWVESGA